MSLHPPPVHWNVALCASVTAQPPKWFRHVTNFEACAAHTGKKDTQTSQCTRAHSLNLWSPLKKKNPTLILNKAHQMTPNLNCCFLEKPRSLFCRSHTYRWLWFKHHSWITVSHHCFTHDPNGPSETSLPDTLWHTSHNCHWPFPTTTVYVK